MTAGQQPEISLCQFQSEGFVAVPQFLRGEELAELQRHVNRFITQIVPDLPSEDVFYEDRTNRDSLKQIQRMGHHDPWFHRLFTSGRFRTLAETLLQGPVTPRNLQYFNKPARMGQPTPAHQDGFYFMLDPCDAVTMWFALDRVDEENGCVRYIPGSHRRGMRPHARTNTLGFSQGIVDYPTEEDRVREFPVPASPGDLLVHDAMTIHRADGNRSHDRSRRALGFVYYSQRAREDLAAHQEYQQRLKAELKSAGRI